LNDFVSQVRSPLIRNFTIRDDGMRATLPQQLIAFASEQYPQL